VSKVRVSPDIAERLREFVGSALFTVHSDIAKSEYWKRESDLLRTDISETSVTISGSSGFYVPSSSSSARRAIGKVLRAIKEPRKAAGWVGRRIGAPFKLPRLLPFDRAFDAVMRHDPVSDPDLSRFRINHLALCERDGRHATAESVRRDYEKWSGYAANEQIITCYYYKNVLGGYLSAQKIGTVLEIGAGNGNLPSILFHHWAPVKVMMIDLPETLAIAIPFLSGLFPGARIAMPQEIQASGLPLEFDFAFLTVDQLNLLSDDSVDLAINCHSFQEMTHDQIAAYFSLVQRVCRESGHFFVANRIEKIPSGAGAYTVEQLEPPNRFAEYPWSAKNEVRCYEVSRLARLTQLDAIAIRLERVRK
jgi:putative sugar O-methyltransferase